MRGIRAACMVEGAEITGTTRLRAAPASRRVLRLEGCCESTKALRNKVVWILGLVAVRALAAAAGGHSPQADIMPHQRSLCPNNSDIHLADAAIEVKTMSKHQALQHRRSDPAPT